MKVRRRLLVVSENGVIPAKAGIQKFRDWIPEPAPCLIRRQARNDNDEQNFF